MTILESKANEVTELVAAKKGVSNFDPALIFIIYQIITALVKMWQDCRKTPVEALDNAKNPGILSRWIMRRIVNRKLGNKVDQVGDEVKEALTKVGKKLTLAEIETMFKEV